MYTVCIRGNGIYTYMYTYIYACMLYHRKNGTKVIVRYSRACNKTSLLFFCFFRCFNVVIIYVCRIADHFARLFINGYKLRRDKALVHVSISIWASHRYTQHTHMVIYILITTLCHCLTLLAKLHGCIYLYI